MAKKKTVPQKRVLRPVRRCLRRHQCLGGRRHRDREKVPAPDRQALRRAARHHRRADRGPDRRLQGKPGGPEGLRYTPAGAFGSARFKLKGLEQNRAEYERLIEVFKAHDIGYFFYNGGNDSMDTALKVSQIGESLGYPITCVGVPKTVDNDLPHTDCCPGFGSVAKYIAVSTREAGLDVASMARTSTKVFVLEVMGRHAGWIAAAGGLAGTQARRAAAHHPVPRNALRDSRSSSTR